MINIAVVRYNLAGLIPDEICDALYVPWTGFEEHPVWSPNAGLYNMESFNAEYNISDTDPNNWRVITGGEPFLQGGLESFVGLLYDAIGCPIRVDTDGAFPGRIKNLVQKEVVAHMGIRIWAPLSKYRRLRLIDESVIQQSLYEVTRSVSNEVIIPFDPNFVNLECTLDEINSFDIEQITVIVLGEPNMEVPDSRLDYLYGIDDRYDPKEIASELSKEFTDNRIKITY